MKKILFLALVVLVSLSFAAAVKAEEERPLYGCELNLYDTPNDDGISVELEFMPLSSPDEVPQYGIDLYVDGVFMNTLTVVNAQALFIYTVPTDKRGAEVRAEVFAYDAEGTRQGPVQVEKAISTAQWYYSDRIGAFIWSMLFIGLIMILIGKAKKGQDIFIRRIAGLEAIDDAVGRATEMGRPVFYIPGTSIIDDIATLASLNILRPVAQQVATYETPFSVPIKDPVVLTVAQDIVKEAYMAAGRADLHDEGMVYLASVGQFDYAAAVNGAMVREKPATVFLLGMFWAESLMLAETANTVGAIQIAGTDATSQLPFFIAACDYTLIGEELYAASAYMSREPLLLGTLKAQDMIKGAVIFAMLLSLVFMLFGIDSVMNFFFQ
ncbi:MAG TPA: hypothetical protein ENN72_03570 [Firmicutes bacterium]|nr:hypothetical protein [Bacillota bacterium]